MRTKLDDLLGHDEFVHRHIGPDDEDRATMLAVVGASSMEELLDAVVPEDIRSREPLPLAGSRTEVEVLAELRALASHNRVATSLIGMGYYGTFTPPVIVRNVLENPAWYTAYTPYQPEISQGRLEALLNFQTMVADLTGMDLANASLLDEATAAAEAMAMAHRLAKGDRTEFFVDADTHPQTISVLATRAEPIGIELVIGSHAELDVDRCFGALFSYPGSSGAVVDHRAVIDVLHAGGADRGGHDRPAGVCAAGVAGHARRRHRGRVGATLRCADGLRRSACGVHRGA